MIWSELIKMALLQGLGGIFIGLALDLKELNRLSLILGIILLSIGLNIDVWK